ncbi:hypothetical protein [Kibdelosporangium phytohabitans]|uniref:Uncharacterized protein n=1 Tax=Kibdelosporangium phytohabitans TaxID=860235 RepID=A0A0N7F3M5_9PSEU|nr:hypothetical protein [Kibdelosporangium phytohabitans]ALG09047.1 hypothetical protein AOZ06_20900 [Kibdelosporangium phytohabitans]MBE1469767.1 thymidine phosphorylase [Kibdelosporangium phytohabitans]
MIATVTTTAATTAATAAVTTAATSTLTDTIETFFAGMDLRPSGTDIVIDQLDQWRNPKHAVAGFTQTFNLVIVAGHDLPAGS